MNDTFPITADQSPGEKPATGSATRIKAAAWTAGLSVFFILAGCGDSPTWPSAFIVMCAFGFVGYVCHLILYYR